MPRRKKRYAVVVDKERKFVSGRNGGLAWTTDRKEAEDNAAALGGRVVDADEWRANPTFLESER